MWREKPPDAESAIGAAFPESAGKAPHLSGARGVGQILQDGFEFYAFAHTTACISGLSLIKELIFVRKDRVYNV